MSQTELQLRGNLAVPLGQNGAVFEVTRMGCRVGSRVAVSVGALPRQSLLVGKAPARGLAAAS